MFNINLILVAEYGMSMTDIENMIPWERSVFLKLLASHVKKKNEMRQKAIEAMNH